jgi:hypothetical protein
MKKLIALLALLTLPALAHANGEIPRGMASPYVQIKEMAQKQGLMKKGSGQRLYLKAPKVGAKQGVIEAKITGIGGMTGTEKNVTLATGSFKFVQEADGRVVEGGEFAKREF